MTKYEFREEDKALFREGDFERFAAASVKDENRFIVWDLQYQSYPVCIKCPDCGGMAVKADDSSDYVCVNPECDFKYFDACDHPDDFIDEVYVREEEVE